MYGVIIVGRYPVKYGPVLIFHRINYEKCNVCCLQSGIDVTVHTPLSREVFWHEYAKIPRHTSQNSIAAGNLE